MGIANGTPAMPDLGMQLQNTARGLDPNPLGQAPGMGQPGSKNLTQPPVPGMDLGMNQSAPLGLKDKLAQLLMRGRK
jgi:hypothetical protein